MLRGILLFIVGFVIFIAIVLTILFHKAIKTLKIFRSNAERAAERAARKAAAEEEYFRRTSTKNYRPDDKPNFEKDYFKSADEEKQDATKQQRRQQQRRSTTTSEGVTIIDHRDSGEAQRKIFSDDEGEYTDFEEV